LTGTNHYYLLGRSGLRVSRLALGTMNFGVEDFHQAYGKTAEGEEPICAAISMPAEAHCPGIEDSHTLIRASPAPFATGDPSRLPDWLRACPLPGLPSLAKVLRDDV
jgi:hypothetical protein